MSILVLQATVYRCSDNRRYFTKRAAVRHEAWLAFKRDNEPDQDPDSGRTFYTDQQMKEFGEFVRTFKPTTESSPCES